MINIKSYTKRVKLDSLNICTNKCIEVNVNAFIPKYVSFNYKGI